MALNVERSDRLGASDIFMTAKELVSDPDGSNWSRLLDSLGPLSAGLRG